MKKTRAHDTSCGPTAVYQLFRQAAIEALSARHPLPNTESGGALSPRDEPLRAIHQQDAARAVVLAPTE